jgi:hypothetical protein
MSSERRQSKNKRTVTISREIVRLSQEQVELLAAFPISKWTELQVDGYRRRQHRISELSDEMIEPYLLAVA